MVTAGDAAPAVFAAAQDDASSDAAPAASSDGAGDNTPYYVAGRLALASAAGIAVIAGDHCDGGDDNIPTPPPSPTPPPPPTPTTAAPQLATSSQPGVGKRK